MRGGGARMDPHPSNFVLLWAMKLKIFLIDAEKFKLVEKNSKWKAVSVNLLAENISHFTEKRISTFQFPLKRFNNWTSHQVTYFENCFIYKFFILIPFFFLPWIDTTKNRISIPLKMNFKQKKNVQMAISTSKSAILTPFLNTKNRISIPLNLNFWAKKIRSSVNLNF